MRLLRALEISPIVYHLNEGHSAFLTYEIAYHEMKQHGKGFLEELDHAKQRIVFTNHTLIAAGNDTFNKDIVSTLLRHYAEEVQVPVDDLVSLGGVPDSSLFSLTTLALRMAQKTNAVSKLHANKALEIWPTNSLIPITNGIHIPTWDGIVQDNDIAKIHTEQKKNLLKYIAEITGVHWGEDVFLLGWARRMVSYKRPLALFDDIRRLMTFLDDEEYPMRIVFAGQAHESDMAGAETLMMLQQHIEGDLKGKVVYLPDYALALAKRMVAGADVWLNTPVVGFEACGTSGMKAALNGNLPITTNDGWVFEADIEHIGWILDSDRINQSIFDTLKQKVLPLYYKDKAGWETHMKNSRELIKNNFSATKMLRQYIEILYTDAIRTQHQE
jgi:glycogen phosphorylase